MKLLIALALTCAPVAAYAQTVAADTPGIELMENAGRVLTRTQIAETVWHINFDTETNVVEVAIRRLRVKLDVPFEQSLLHTVRGVGYILESRNDGQPS